MNWIYFGHFKQTKDNAHLTLPVLVVSLNHPFLQVRQARLFSLALAFLLLAILPAFVLPALVLPSLVLPTLVALVVPSVLISYSLEHSVLNASLLTGMVE